MLYLRGGLGPFWTVHQEGVDTQPVPELDTEIFYLPPGFDM
jgi:hypothetical protein